MAGYLHGHDKRVTMNLARLSACCSSELRASLNRISEVGYDVAQLSQEDVETIYTEFNEDLERSVLSEWTVVTDYLVDLGQACEGICPLCRHEGLRFLFKLRNQQNQSEIETGSVCICTHQISVKGAETAEHARRILETMVRRHLRKLELAEWHEAYGFEPAHFDRLRDSLERVRNEHAPSNMIGCWVGEDIQLFTRAADYVGKLRTLKRFYDRSGWLGTRKKWEVWVKLARFARVNDTAMVDQVPAPIPFKEKPQTAVQLAKVIQLPLAGVA